MFSIISVCQFISEKTTLYIKKSTVNIDYVSHVEICRSENSASTLEFPFFILFLTLSLCQYYKEVTCVFVYGNFRNCNIQSNAELKKKNNNNGWQKAGDFLCFIIGYILCPCNNSQVDARAKNIL